MDYLNKGLVVVGAAQVGYLGYQNKEWLFNKALGVGHSVEEITRTKFLSDVEYYNLNNVEHKKILENKQANTRVINHNVRIARMKRRKKKKGGKRYKKK